MSFFSSLENFGKKTALIRPGGGTVSYTELARQCDSFASAMSEGKQLLLIETRNEIECIIGYLAALRRGDAVMLMDAELDGEMKRRLIESYQPDLLWKRDVEGYRLEKRHKAEGNLHEALALLLSTSGSTGSPKCVRLTAKNVASNADAIAEYLALTKDEVAVTLLPLHYSFGLSILNSHLSVGAAVVVQDKGVVDREFWHTVAEQKVTSLSGVPFIYETLLKLRFDRMKLPHLRSLTQAGGRLAPGIVEQYASYCEKTGRRFYVMYGQTEATARISRLLPEKAYRKPTSIGGPIPGGAMMLRDDNGRTIDTPGQEGELVYSGPNVMMGYAHGREDLHRGDELNGTLYTGDVARFDEEGDFYIVGRMKRFVKLFGRRFSLDETESYLQTMGIKAACGGTDDHLAIAIEGVCDTEKLRDHLSSRFRVNRTAIYIETLPELPRNPNGKIDYGTLFMRRRS